MRSTSSISLSKLKKNYLLSNSEGSKGRHCVIPAQLRLPHRHESCAELCSSDRALLLFITQR